MFNDAEQSIPKHRLRMTTGRILQISNNVTEEYCDLGQTNFATKQELCEVIRFWQRHSDKWSALHQKLIGKVTTLATEVLQAKPHP